MPYKWFLVLEQKGNPTPFREQTHIQKLGYLARTPDQKNPDGLPVGFTRDGDHVGFTCAACHTQQIVSDNKAYLVDGASTLADVEQFHRSLTESLQDTFDNDAKFKRFADAVLGATADAAQRDTLKSELQNAVTFRKDYNKRDLSGQNDMHPRFGPGRVDAIGSILNEVSTLGAKLPANFQPANAPVSYPFLWDTPQHDRVQWNGAVENSVNLLAEPIFGTKHIGALGRNVGEVLGVFGTFEVVPDGILPKGYPSSVNLKNLIALEDSIRELWSPQWPMAFGAIDSVKKTAGESLFRTHCIDCHLADRTHRQESGSESLAQALGRHRSHNGEEFFDTKG